MNFIYEEDEPIKGNPIIDAVKENPEMITKTFEGVGNLFNQAINAKVFKKKK